jgi:hypothetical protein
LIWTNSEAQNYLLIKEIRIIEWQNNQRRFPTQLHEERNKDSQQLKTKECQALIQWAKRQILAL